MSDVVGVIFLILLVMVSVVWLFWSDKIWSWLSQTVEKSYVGNDSRHY